jgi:hypothetical protein
MEHNDQDFLKELNEKISKLLSDSDGNTIEKMGILGCVRHRLIGPDGNIKQEGQVFNLVNSVGDRWLAHYMCSSIVGDTRSMWAELGVNTTAPVKGGTGLGTLISASSLAVSASYPTRVDSFSGTGEWTQWRFSWGAGVATNGSIGEVGMRTQAGSFVAHAIVSPNVNKAAGDTLQIDWAWKFLGA